MALQVICAETTEQAEFIRSSRDIARINALRGKRVPMISPEEASSVKLSPFEIQHLEHINRHSIQGSPSTIKHQILEAARMYGSTNVSIVTNCHYYEDRLRSYSLISEAFNLPKYPLSSVKPDTDARQS